MSLADAAAPPPAPHPAAPDAPADTAPLLNSFVTPPQCSWRSIPSQSEFWSFYTYYKFAYIYYVHARTFIDWLGSKPK